MDPQNSQNLAKNRHIWSLCLGSTIPSNGQTNELITDPTVTLVSEKKGLTNAQVLLLWALQKGHSVLPKSTNPKHIKENIELKDITLSDEEMKHLDDIQVKIKYAWNPDSVI